MAVPIGGTSCMVSKFMLKRRFFSCKKSVIEQRDKGGDKFEDLLNLLEKSFTHIIIVKNL